MYQVFNLGLLIGTKLGFAWWLLLFIALGLVVAIKRIRLTLLQLARQFMTWFDLATKGRLFFFVRIASGNQGLPVQLEIFEQNLATRVRSICRQFRNLPKILR